MCSFFTVMLLCIRVSLSFAVEPLLIRDFTYGIELTATTDQNPEYDISKPVNGQLYDFTTIAALTSGEILPTTAQGEVSVRTPGGTWVFENDSGVLEIASPVLTLARLNETDAVFKTFAFVGLRPEVKLMGLEGGGGHIHLGRQIFERNPILLRNFIVDLLNRPSVQSVLEEVGDDQSQNLRQRGLEKQLAVELKKLDARFLSGETVTVEDVARTVLGSFKDGKELNPPTDGSIYDWLGRYSDINLTNLLTGLHPTIELRLMRAPTSTREVIERARFFTRYLQFLDSRPGLLELKSVTAAETAWNEMPSIVEMSWTELITELGLDPLTYHRQWEGRFPSIVSSGGLEIREGRSPIASDFVVYEMRYSGATAPPMRVTVDGNSLFPHFREVRPGMWIARLPLSVTDKHLELHIESLKHLSGTYRIGDGRTRGEFISTCEGLLRGKH